MPRLLLLSEVVKSIDIPSNSEEVHKVEFGTDLKQVLLVRLGKHIPDALSLSSSLSSSDPHTSSSSSSFPSSSSCSSSSSSNKRRLISTNDRLCVTVQYVKKTDHEAETADLQTYHSSLIEQLKLSAYRAKCERDEVLLI